MALAEKYVIMFQKECSNLSIIVLNNLHRLKVNPKDSIAIEKMLVTEKSKEVEFFIDIFTKIIKH